MVDLYSLGCLYRRRFRGGGMEGRGYAHPIVGQILIPPPLNVKLLCQESAVKTFAKASPLPFENSWFCPLIMCAHVCVYGCFCVFVKLLQFLIPVPEIMD